MYIWISCKTLWTQTLNIVDTLSTFCTNTTCYSRTWLLLMRSTSFIWVSACSSIANALIGHTILTMGIRSTSRWTYRGNHSCKKRETVATWLCSIVIISDTWKLWHSGEKMIPYCNIYDIYIQNPADYLWLLQCN